MDKATLQFFLNDKARALGSTLKVPREGDAGFDLCCVEDVTIPVRGFALIETGAHLAIPLNWVGLIRDRSSVALRGGAVTAGVIDASYRGELKVAMHNLGNDPLIFKKGEKIAQCVVVPHLPGVAAVEAISLEVLGTTERGDGGFGSTGA